MAGSHRVGHLGSFNIDPLKHLSIIAQKMNITVRYQHTLGLTQRVRESP